MSDEATLDEFAKSDNGTIKKTGQNWPIKKIKHHTKLISGEHVKSNKVHTDSRSEPYLTGPDDFDGFGFRVTKYTDDPTKFCESGDTLVTVKGSGCGKTAFAPSRACISRQIKALRPESTVNSLHLYYSVSSKENFLNTLSEGSAIPGLSNSHLTSLDIPVPPLPEQRKIATVLYTVDQAIQKTEEIIDQMNTSQQGLTRTLFGKGEIRQDGKKETKIERLGPKKFKVPTAWDVTSISSIGEVVTGDTPSTNNDANFGGSLPFVTPESLTQEKYVTKTERTLSETGREDVNPIPKGSVMMGCIGNIGKIAMANCEVATNQQINSVVIQESEYLPEFLYYHLQVLSDFIKSQAGQTTIPIVNKSSFESFEVFNPPIEEQREIVERLSVYDEGRRINSQYLDELTRLKQGLIQDLLSGTVRTTDTNIQVPDEVAQHG